MTMRARTSHPWLLPLMTCGLMAGVLLGRQAEAWHGAAAGLAVCTACALLQHGKRRTVGAVLTALFLGALLGWNAWNPRLPAEGEYAVTGVVVQAVEVDEQGQAQSVLRDMTVDGVPCGDGYWTFYPDDGEPLPDWLIPGARVGIAARVYHPGGRENPEGFDFREYLLQRDIQLGVYGWKELTQLESGFSLQGAIARLRHDLTQRLMAVMGADAGGYAAAMLLGERTCMPDTELAAFSKLGIMHILSISGYHVGVLSAMLALMLLPWRLRRSRALLVRGGILLAYCLLTGGHAPVIRAALLSLMWEAGRVRNRQALSLHMLCASAAVQLIFTPPLLTSASFQLTYSAMAGLLLLRPGIERLLTVKRWFLDGVWRAFAACLAAQLGVLPVQLYWFGSLPLMSLAANLMVIPLFTGLLFLYWLTFALLWLPGVRSALGWLSMTATGLLMNGIRPLGLVEGAYLYTRRPDVLVLLGWGMVCVSLLALFPAGWKHRRRVLAGVGALLTLTVLLPLPHAETTYIQFSVGEEDAALLHDRDAVIVIDTGESGQTVAEYLRGRGLPVDMLILTHLHSDHALGVTALLDEAVPIRRCYVPVDAEVAAVDPAMPELLSRLAAAGTEICPLSRGDVLTLPSGTLTVLWPEEGRTRPGQDANHSSLVLLAELHGTKLLLTGDLTGTYERYAAAQADVLKAAHHGSESSTSPDFLAAVDPQAILLSCGDEAREISMAGRAGDIPVYSTHSSGAITIRFDEGGFRVYPFLQGE